MWIVKISGGLIRNPVLPRWLELMAQLGGGRVTIVCGSGRFGEEAIHVNAHWKVGNSLQSHNMAVLAMAQTSYLAWSLEPKLRLAGNESSIRRVLRAGHTALWLPLELLQDSRDVAACAGVGSDFIALDLACRLNAERLVLVRSSDMDTEAERSKLGARKSHSGFDAVASGVSFPIDVVDCHDWLRVRALLHGDVAPINVM